MHALHVPPESEEPPANCNCPENGEDRIGSQHLYRLTDRLRQSLPECLASCSDLFKGPLAELAPNSASCAAQPNAHTGSAPTAMQKRIQYLGLTTTLSTTCYDRIVTQASRTTEARNGYRRDCPEFRRRFLNDPRGH